MIITLIQSQESVAFSKYYYKLFNDKMEKSFFQSQDADSKSMFDQTFGRGCAIKYRQPAFSERNKFELQRLNQNQAKQRNGESFIYIQQSKDRYNLHSSKEFDKIDQINSKIHGLIKSISASCHKKMPIGFKKTQINKYKEQEPEPQTRSVHKVKYLDQQKTQKKKHIQIQSLLQSKLFEAHLPQGKQSINTLSTFDNHYNELQQQAYEKEIDGRIKKINQKINNYQNKMKFNHSKQVNKSQISIKRQHGLRQFKDHSNLYHLTPKKIENPNVTKIEPNKSKYILNQKQNEFQKKAINEKSFVKMDPSKKLTYFRDKYANVNNRQQNHEFKQVIKKESKPKKAQAPLINKQLLLYKTAFIKEIVNQIVLDQEFRHAKHMFGGIQGLADEEANLNGARWNKLQRQLKNEGFNLPISEVKDIFMPRDDQIDPFMSVSHSHEQLVHGVIDTYRICQKNWNQKMYHSWSVWELNESKFTSQNLDQGRKGYITLEDFTFYLNTELDGSYRNRDLLLIFNRLKGARKGKQEQQAIRYKHILDKLISA